MKKIFVAAATVAIFALLVSSPAFGAAGGNGGGGDRQTGHITVSDAVYGGMTTATVNPGGENVYVYVTCRTDGKVVYAAFFPVDGNNHADIGPLWSTLWSNSSAQCSAEEGYFTRNGFGKWVIAASTTFNVSPSA